MAVRRLSIYIGNYGNPFILVVETSLKTLNFHIIHVTLKPYIKTNIGD